MQTLPISLPELKIQQFCQKYRVRRLSLFGSVLREDFAPESDVDFLVEFGDGETPGFFGLAQMQDELSIVVERDVDLRTIHELSHYFRDRVLGEAMSIYDCDR